MVKVKVNPPKNRYNNRFTGGLSSKKAKKYRKFILLYHIFPKIPQ